MAEERVTIRVGVEGGQQAARSFEDMARAGQGLAQRVQGMAGSVQSLASALGSRDRTAGLVANVAGATAQFAAMGSMLGPAGTVIGGIVGLTTGLIGAVRASSDASSATSTLAADLSTMADRARSAETRIRAMNAAIAESARSSRLDMGVASMREYGEEIATVEARIDALNIALGGMAPGAAGERSVNRALREARARLEELTGLRDSAASEESSMMMEDLIGAANPTATRSAGSGRNRELDAWNAAMASMREEAAYEERLWSETLASINTDVEDSLAERTRLREEAAERDREIAERDFENQREINEALADAEREYQDRIAEGRQAAKEAEMDEEELATERRRQNLTELMGLVGDATMSFGKAIGSIALGEQTAEEAFAGLAKSFLEMISQYTSLKAATEFAEAGAAFARYDYGGGAAHIAAGAAFTAVAVATGVGAAAINTAPTAPARPEQAAPQSGGGGGGDVNIFWNSPVVTGATEAELGRNLRQLISAGAV